jgi:ribosomal protein L40E
MRIKDLFGSEEPVIIKKKPKFLQKKAHNKNICRDCKSSYYYDVVRCPICSSSNLETIKMEVMQ